MWFFSWRFCGFDISISIYHSSQEPLPFSFLNESKKRVNTLSLLFFCDFSSFAFFPYSLPTITMNTMDTFGSPLIVGECGLPTDFCPDFVVDSRFICLIQKNTFLNNTEKNQNTIYEQTGIFIYLFLYWVHMHSLLSSTSYPSLPS